MDRDDTIKLLRECNAGIKMGINAIDEVFDSVSDAALSRILTEAKRDHEALEDEMSVVLEKYGVKEKEPGVMASTMSWFKTNMKLAINESDETVANLITDGCNMGVKSLHRYMNEYENAEKSVKDMVRKLINIEDNMITKMEKYL